MLLCPPCTTRAPEPRFPACFSHLPRNRLCLLRACKTSRAQPAPHLPPVATFGEVAWPVLALWTCIRHMIARQDLALPTLHFLIRRVACFCRFTSTKLAVAIGQPAVTSATAAVAGLQRQAHMLTSKSLRGDPVARAAFTTRKAMLH